TRAHATPSCAAATIRSPPFPSTCPTSSRGRRHDRDRLDAMKQVLFEEDGAFRVGTILGEAGASLQVEAAHGKRSKVKAASILLRFDGQPLAAFMPEAQKLSEPIDPQFLWEVSGGDEFSFEKLAADYFGRAPTPQEAAAVVLTLHARANTDGMAAPTLLARAGALEDPEDYFLRRLAFEFFPGGTGFPPTAPLAEPQGLEQSGARAFSIDDEETTEIDDAFSVTDAGAGALTIGIHIAAPALLFGRDHPLEAIARARLSTVYFPGGKIT